MLFEELHSQPVASEPAPTVEVETAAPSTSENETTLEAETPEVATLEQPADEGTEPPRAQKRIQELIRKNKELELQKATYWDALNAQVPEATASDDDEDNDSVTVDSIADAVIRKQKSEQIEQARAQAQADMARSALEAIEAHPELETDDELADIVVAYAERNKVSFKAAADRVKQRMVHEQKKAEAKLLADRSLRTGVSTPSAGRVSGGELPPPNLSNMSEDDKRANWDKIISGFGRT